MTWTPILKAFTCLFNVHHKTILNLHLKNIIWVSLAIVHPYAPPGFCRWAFARADDHCDVPGCSPAGDYLGFPSCHCLSALLCVCR